MYAEQSKNRVGGNFNSKSAVYEFSDVYDLFIIYNSYKLFRKEKL